MIFTSGRKERRSSRQKAAEHSLEEAPGNGCRSSGILLSQFQCNAAGSELEKSVASERAVPDDPVSGWIKGSVVSGWMQLTIL